MMLRSKRCHIYRNDEVLIKNYEFPLQNPKFGAKVLLFSDIRKFFPQKLAFFIDYWWIWKGKEPISSPSTKKSAL